MDLSEKDKALFDAIKKQDLDKIKEAIKDANVNVKDMFDGCPLHVAARLGNVKIINLLCENGADIEGKDSTDMTPLMAATLEGHFEAAEALLEKGAKITTDLAMSLEKKVSILEENAERGMIKPEAVKAWQAFLEKMKAHSRKQ